MIVRAYAEPGENLEECTDRLRVLAATFNGLTGPGGSGLSFELVLNGRFYRITSHTYTTPKGTAFTAVGGA